MTPESQTTPVSATPAELTDAERQTLCEIARQSIVAYLTRTEIPDFAVSGSLVANGAAFVTLMKDGELRGCVGTVEAYLPLYLAVSQCAVSAAVADPRFDSVSLEELPHVAIELSVLTPMIKISDRSEIQVGRDGLMIRLGRRSGLLLPHVATEYHWDSTTFLEHTCRKAGLPCDAYLRPEAAIYRFQATIFGETPLSQHS